MYKQKTKEVRTRANSVSIQNWETW